MVPGSHKVNFVTPESMLAHHSPTMVPIRCPEGSLLIFTEALTHAGGEWFGETDRMAIFNACETEPHCRPNMHYLPQSVTNVCMYRTPDQAKACHDARVVRITQMGPYKHSTTVWISRQRLSRQCQPTGAACSVAYGALERGN